MFSGRTSLVAKQTILMVAMLFVAGESISGPIQGLTLTWPVPSGGSASPPSQDYSEWNQASLNSHHSGLDIGAPSGTSVVAAAAGTVAEVIKLGSTQWGQQTHCMGNVVILRHGSGSAYTLYAHLRQDSISVSAEQWVSAGQKIAEVGNTLGQTSTGESCGSVGAHLHFELKNHPYLGANNASHDVGPWGYTPQLGESGQMIPSHHPDAFNYHDPILNLHSNIIVYTPPRTATVTSVGGGVSLRKAPGTNYGATGISTSVGQSYRAAAHLDSNTTGCSLGWVQIQRPLGSSPAYFNSRYPDAWVCKGNNGETWIEVDSDSPTTYTLSVTKSGAGSGTVTSSPSGINCGSTCSADFDSGASVTLDASASGGSTFAGWGGACSGTGACNVIMSQARSISATFNVTGTSQPDLIVQSISINPTMPGTGGSFSADLVVKNQGSAASSGGYLDVYLDEPGGMACNQAGAAFVSLDTIGIGATKSFSLLMQAPASQGNYDLRAFVDSFCNVAESSENNNQATLTYTVTSDTSAPGVITDPATDITFNGAVMRGRVNPNWAQTTTFVQYGTSAAYGGESGGYTLPQTDSSYHNIVWDAYFLSCSTTYHYRYVAFNSQGTTYGSDQPFTTSACPQEKAYINAIYSSSSYAQVGVHRHQVGAFPGGMSSLGSTNAAIFGMDFSSSSNILWAAVDGFDPFISNSGTYGRINQSTGAYSPDGNLTGWVSPGEERLLDLVIDPSSGQAFVVSMDYGTSTSVNRLYSLNLSNGALLHIGSSNGGSIIDAAIACNGQMYGHRFAADGSSSSELVSINRSNGATTTIGNTGFRANYAQGMDFDAQTGLLYMYHYNSTSNNDDVLRYGTVNLSTGALTPIYTSPVGQAVEAELAIATTCPTTITDEIFASGFD